MLTIAIGRPIYIEMAVALARSFYRWNTDGSIAFTLVTDRPVSERPADLASVDWRTVGSEEFGTGFAIKLFVDQFAAAARTLFIDSDCLIVRNLDPVFERMAGKPVGVIGKSISDGEWFGDVRSVCRKLGLSAMPRFNGGIYYVEKGETSTSIYTRARQLLPDYDALGFVRLRGKENDEVIMSASMAEHGVEAVPDDGTVMNTLLEAPGGLKIDVLRGTARLMNPKNHPRHFDFTGLEILEPAIVHFLGTNADEHPYRTEIEVLDRIARGWSPARARAYVSLRLAAPAIALRTSKNLLRPLFHAAFGARKVRASLR